MQRLGVGGFVWGVFVCIKTEQDTGKEVVGEHVPHSQELACFLCLWMVDDTVAEDSPRSLLNVCLFLPLAFDQCTVEYAAISSGSMLMCWNRGINFMRGSWQQVAAQLSKTGCP